ncbi:MAG: hypothetical protein CMJ35_01730 [Phycisphaerae bacterium]|nr:hypothetical protein [Phycisphaerae bacterium]
MKTLAKATLIVLSLSLPLMISCSTSSRFEPTGNPLLDLRNPELLERDRIAAARAAWSEVEEGIRDRERTRYALKNLAWSGGTERPLRLTVIELLMSDESPEGNADSRAMARLMLPNEKDTEAVRIIAVRAVESDWDDLAPALVRSLARPDSAVPDRERIEYLALQELRPGVPIEQVVFDVFLNPGQGGGDNQEVTVLRSLQRTRDEAWGLLGRLDPSGTLRKQLIASPSSLDAETSAESRQMILDLRAIQDELGVIPNTAMEIAWLTSLRHHSDPRNSTQNTAWWGEVANAVSMLDAAQRQGLRMRHLEPVRWASQNRPAWLGLDHEALYAVLNTRLSGRVVYKRKAEKGEPIRQERLGDWVSMLSWGDLLSILIVDEALQNPIVVEQLFTQRALDRKDTSTEYGGIIETDPDTGWRAVLFRPRQRDRVSDQRFVASDDMFRFSDRALAHYHFHADQRDNTRYAGPSHGDQVNAAHSARTNIVLTSMGEDTLGVDVYFDHGAVIDLGRLEYDE